MTATTTPFIASLAVSPLIRLHIHDNVLVAKTALSLGQDLPEIGARARAGAGRAQDRGPPHC